MKYTRGSSGKHTKILRQKSAFLYIQATKILRVLILTFTRSITCPAIQKREKGSKTSELSSNNQKKVAYFSKNNFYYKKIIPIKKIKVLIRSMWPILH